MIGIRIFTTDNAGNPDDSIRHWLAGDPAANPPTKNPGISDESRNVPRLQQEDGGAGWPYKTFADRGNASVQIGFNTSRQFSSVAAAWQWRNRFSRLNPTEWPHPLEGTMVMRCSTGGNAWVEELVRGCVLSVSGLRGDGLTVSINYQFNGGYTEAYHSGLTTHLIDANGVRLIDASGHLLIADTLT